MTVKLNAKSKLSPPVRCKQRSIPLSTSSEGASGKDLSTAETGSILPREASVRHFSASRAQTVAPFLGDAVLSVRVAYVLRSGQAISQDGPRSLILRIHALVTSLIRYKLTACLVTLVRLIGEDSMK